MSERRSKKRQQRGGLLRRDGKYVVAESEIERDPRRPKRIRRRDRELSVPTRLRDVLKSLQKRQQSISKDV